MGEEVNTSWGTVWEIAGKRYQTNLGEKTLTDHGFEVLQAFVAAEQRSAMKEALGGMYRAFSY
jgi:hypothetical protein